MNAFFQDECNYAMDPFFFNEWKKPVVGSYRIIMLQYKRQWANLSPTSVSSHHSTGCNYYMYISNYVIR